MQKAGAKDMFEWWQKCIFGWVYFKLINHNNVQTKTIIIIIREIITRKD